MKKLVLLSLIVILFTSCQKNYKYVKLVLGEDIYGEPIGVPEDTTNIKAENDSAAYIQAYTNFCISLKTERSMMEKYDFKMDLIVGFKLYNKKGEEITDEVSFSDKKEQENKIKDQIFSMKLDSDSDKDNTEDFSKFDTLKIKELEKYFNLRKDEFSNNNEIWYRPKSAPRYINSNGLFCYFETENGKATNLRFCMQYYSEDWLFFSSVKFSIDGKAYEFTPIEVKTDSGNGGYIWEWFDEGVYGSKKDLVIALSNAKSAKMLIVGNQYNKTKEITKDQINSIKRTLELYNALGGE